mmetsp:Transcript_24064/g.73692  ORF Transcript_24064/g.73692 Transcript_24064/m.73692 type:complete len:244 (+) Transcript_24064:2005-2736(+)
MSTTPVSCWTCLLHVRASLWSSSALAPKLRLQAASASSSPQRWRWASPFNLHQLPIGVAPQITCLSTPGTTDRATVDSKRRQCRRASTTLSPPPLSREWSAPLKCVRQQADVSDVSLLLHLTKHMGFHGSSSVVSGMRSRVLGRPTMVRSGATRSYASRSADERRFSSDCVYQGSTGRRRHLFAWRFLMAPRGSTHRPVGASPARAPSPKAAYLHTRPEAYASHECGWIRVHIFAWCLPSIRL